MKTFPRSILLENNGWVTDDVIEFANSIDPNYKELSPDTDDYQFSDSLRWFGKLINPNLKNLIVSSAFGTPSFNEDETGFNTQVAWFMAILEEAVIYRKENEIGGLKLFIKYSGSEGAGGISFLDWLGYSNDSEHDYLLHKLKFFLRPDRELPINIFVIDGMDFKKLTLLTHETLLTINNES